MPSDARYLFFISGDSQLLRNALHETISGVSSKQQVETRTFWGDDGLTDSFWEELTLQGLFATPKILILRNAQNILAAGLKSLSEAINRAPDLVTLLICLEVPFERDNKPKVAQHILKLPCYIHAEKMRWIKTLAPLQPNSLQSFINAEARRLAIILSPDLCARLAASLPPDAALISSELQKISLTADATGKVPDSSIALVEQTMDANIFDMLRRMQAKGDANLVWRQLIEFHQTGESVIFAFLATLTREARSLWQLLVGEQPALPPRVIPVKQALAHSLGFSGIAKLWELTLKSEMRIKNGENTPEQTFEILAADLLMLFHAPSSHPMGFAAKHSR